MNKNYRVRTKQELEDLISECIISYGPDVNLNFIDTSQITDMSGLFYRSEFVGKIDEWDTSKVKNMCKMFSFTKFNGDIGGWDTGQVCNMQGMFSDSRFNKDIGKWNTGNVLTMREMFYHSHFNKDISSWDLTEVIDIWDMFGGGARFNKNLGEWLKKRPDLPLDKIVDPKLLRYVYEFKKRWIEYNGEA